MAQESDVIWKGRPWITPSVVLRTVALVLVAGLAFVFLYLLGQLTYQLLSVSLYLWVSALMALVWLVSLAGLLVRRASSRYVLRRGSLEVVKGIVGRKTLIVSPSGFSELEVDQGVVGRMMDYGSLEVRSQGGQQLNLELIRNPRQVSAKIRDVMTTPTVRIATDQPIAPITKDQKK